MKIWIRGSFHLSELQVWNSTYRLDFPRQFRRLFWVSNVVYIRELFVKSTPKYLVSSVGGEGCWSWGSFYTEERSRHCLVQLNWDIDKVLRSLVGSLSPIKTCQMWNSFCFTGFNAQTQLLLASIHQEICILNRPVLWAIRANQFHATVFVHLDVTTNICNAKERSAGPQ